jgi:hypothetical protein
MKTCFPSFRLFLRAFSRSCLRAASVGSQLGAGAGLAENDREAEIIREVGPAGAVCYFVCLISIHTSLWSPDLAINLDLGCASWPALPYPNNG